jgi:hypothetical protein
MWRLWCCVALVACGDNVQPRDPAVSGARLKLTWYAFDDGHRAWANGGDRYYDSVLASDCTPQTWADGTTYCTPPVSWIGYADAACTQRIGRDVGVTFAAEHVWSCDNWVPARLFRTGATRTLPRYWIRNAAGECYEGGAAGAVVDIGEELPVSTLAPVSSERTAHGEVGTVHRTSPDGLRMPLALYDTATGAVCFTEPLDNVAAARCIPYETLFLEDATTEACSMQPALGIETGCPAPAIALRVLDNGCVEYHALGETCAMMNGTSYLAVEGVIDMPALARAPAAVMSIGCTRRPPCTEGARASAGMSITPSTAR